MTPKNLLSLSRCLCLVLLSLILNMALVSPSLARMGGGHTYSGGQSEGSGGSRGSSRSSGGGGAWSSGYWSGSSSTRQPGYGTYIPAYSHPAENIDPLTSFIEMIFLILLIYVLVRLLRQGSLSGDTRIIKSRSSADSYQADGGFRPIPGIHPDQPYSYGDFAAGNAGLDDKLLALKFRDPNFSRVLFLDFASLFFHKFYTYRGSEQFRQVSPFLSRAIVESTNGNVFYPRQRVHDIVIGEARIKNILELEKTDNILVEFESNLTLQYLKNNEEARFATQERWMFGRQKGVSSPQPSQMRNLSCPSCGAPADFTDSGECQYCHSFIQAGESQWQVVKIDVINNQPFATETPGGYQQEAGTELPTIKQAGLEMYLETFVQTHGLQDWQNFFNGFCERVVKPYFLATYDAWSRGDWGQARHLVSDRLYESNGFWMKEYARQGWRNQLDNIQIQGIEMARIDLDKFYESLTVRVFASCLDYTIDKQGKLIGGSQRVPRQFSEYWTFIRTAGTEKIDNEFDLNACPACGAPADKIGQAGICGYCGSKLTEGHFSWVLAMIIQDEAYDG